MTKRKTTLLSIHRQLTVIFYISLGVLRKWTKSYTYLIWGRRILWSAPSAFSAALNRGVRGSLSANSTRVPHNSFPSSLLSFYLSHCRLLRGFVSSGRNMTANSISRNRFAATFRRGNFHQTLRTIKAIPRVFFITAYIFCHIF